MSRTVTALMLAIEAPVGVLLRTEDAEVKGEEGLLDLFEAAQASAIEALTARLAASGVHYAADEARRRTLPRTTYHTDTQLLGHYLAVGTEADEGANGIGTVALSRLATSAPYAARIADALARWRPFAAFAHRRGVALPEPELYLTIGEV